VSNRLRRAAILASLAIFAAVPVVAQAKANDYGKWIDVGCALVCPACKEVPEGVPPLRQLQVAPGWLGTSGSPDVAHGRVSIGNSSRDPKPTDPGNLVFNPIAHDAICIITHRTTRSEPRSGWGGRRFSAEPFETGAVSPARRSVGRSTSTSGPPPRHAGRVPEDLHGNNEDLQRREPEGVERPRAVGGCR